MGLSSTRNPPRGQLLAREGMLHLSKLLSRDYLSLRNLPLHVQIRLLLRIVPWFSQLAKVPLLAVIVVFCGHGISSRGRGLSVAKVILETAPIVAKPIILLIIVESCMKKLHVLLELLTCLIVLAPLQLFPPHLLYRNLLLYLTLLMAISL